MASKVNRQTPQKVTHDVFEIYDTSFQKVLTPLQIQALYNEIRVGDLSVPQIKESIKYVCIGDECEEDELFDLLQEMDRRYFLVQDLRWEFSMLDRNNSNTITEDQAKWFVQCVHGEFFSQTKWETLLRQRAVPGSGVTFSEIEVLLCNIPSVLDLMDEEEAQRRALEEQKRRERQRNKMQVGEEERLRRMEAQAAKRRNAKDKAEQDELAKRLQKEQRLKDKLAEEGRQKDEEELEEERRRRAEEEEARRQKELEEEREREEQEAKRLKEEEEKRLKELEEAENYERLLKEAIEKEKEFTDEANRLKNLTDPEGIEAEKRARLKAKEWKHKRIRYALKVAIAKRCKVRLPPAVKEFKDNQLSDDDMDLEKAEKILREFKAKDGLLHAMANPSREELEEHIRMLEGAVNFIKRNGFEYMFRKELKDAEVLLSQLRKRFKIYGEIMALDQPTVAEIKSYSNPPELVHKVMMGTFIMLGHKEKDMQDWQTVRIWVGKTGKDGLKRRCLEYLKDPTKVIPKKSEMTKKLLHQLDVDDVRDVSAGAATFFIWAWTMVEETDMRLAREAYLAEQKAQKEKERQKQMAEGTYEEDEAANDVQAPVNGAVSDTKRRGKETQETFKLTTKGKVKKS